MASSLGSCVHLKLPVVSTIATNDVERSALVEHLKGMRFGIEKEGLRVSATDAHLAQTPHAKALGSALTHPRITTDYSEALLEFVTGTHATPSDALAELDRLQGFAATVLGDNERIWPLSMPCWLPESDCDIPLAYYGESHIGRLKTVYRRGLGFRYGRQMQTIAGVHFNLSFGDDFWAWRAARDGHPDSLDARRMRDTGYFETIRNFRRIQWILMLLTGASPAVDESFRLLATDRFQVSGRSRIAQNATSLRMSDLGYQSTAQESINICFNYLETYCESLSEAVRRSWPTYEGIGLKDDRGFKQLNTAVLQIENEYYSSIRPKRIQEPGERPVRALINRGIEYLEVRAIDLNPYARNGISEAEAGLITLMMAAAAVADSALFTDAECVAINGINARTTWAGRQRHQTYDDSRGLHQAALEFFDSLDELAELLDEAQQVTHHTDALADARVRLQAGCPLLSEEVEQATLHHGHLAFGLKMAEQHHATWRNYVDPDENARLATIAEDSLTAEAQLASANEGSFDAFVAAYVNQP